jgi:16S rRNA U516 pseudouridylate synthase RsuA-like enzyme
MSQREAEQCIRNGDGMVAGQVVTSPHLLVDWKAAMHYTKNMLQNDPPSSLISIGKRLRCISLML